MPDIGDYVIVRSRDSGCVCGEYQGHNGREVTIKNYRQIFRWNGNRLTLVDVSMVPGTITLSRTNPGECVMLEACMINPCSREVEQFLRKEKHS
jgi:hypothetical protein